ncbi:MAG TPA: MBL fold metallo-hydrolase [Patescibacteria group bacterium]|nr:MBL fold metallo-hydrolase [Patescibacteria group bacterium]
MKRVFIIIFFCFLALILVFYYQSQYLSDKKLHIFVCDVGQGDGILIRTPENADIVIDGGPENGKMVACLSKNLPFWDHDIEEMFATHPDADHIGGLTQVLENYKVLSFNTSTLDNKNNTAIFATLIRDIKEQGIPSRLITTGDRFVVSDGVVLTTLWPEKGFTSTDTNPYSLVQLLTYKNFKGLFTGDITYQILDTLPVPHNLDLFKIPHHGSDTGVDDLTFNIIHPGFVPISVGYHNRYHHPKPSVLALLKKYNVPYKRTDEVGTIEIISDGATTKVTTDN